MSAPAPSLAEWVGAPRLPARPVSGFLPTKAPISLESVDSTLDEGDRYEVSMFMDRQTSQSRSVGLCVDTTVPHGGARLFEAAEWDDYDVQCVQVACSSPLPEASKPLVEPLPSEEAIVSFCKAVDSFWSSPRNRRRHIAVVCLTGINVSGFLIVQYLVRCARDTERRSASSLWRDRRACTARRCWARSSRAARAPARAPDAPSVAPHAAPTEAAAPVPL